MENLVVSSGISRNKSRNPQMKGFWHKYKVFSQVSQEKREQCTSVLCPVGEIIKKIIYKGISQTTDVTCCHYVVLCSIEAAVKGENSEVLSECLALVRNSQLRGKHLLFNSKSMWLMFEI